MPFETISPRFAGPAPRLKITDVECHVLLAPDYDASFTSSAQDSRSAAEADTQTRSDDVS